MASSSSPRVGVPRIKYDVFISFRGTDIRHGFLSHLRKALRQKQVDAFVDDRLEGGDEISPALVKAIEGSVGHSFPWSYSPRTMLLQSGAWRSL